MRVAIEMQRLAPGMETGVVVSWLKNVGDTVAVGEPIAEIDTDKVDVEMLAMDAGVLAETVHGPDDEVPVGGVIGWLEA
ncbi:MAG: lipoyl domain-containing protein [Streptosporangiaceae bacterium]